MPFLICVNSTRAVNVTFQVDLSQMVINPLGVYIAGSFQGWDPAINQMTDMGGGIYAITFDLPPGTYQFKFINGNAWGQDENVPIICGVDDGGGIFNREIIVGSDVVLPAICFGQCDPCSPASYVMNGNASSLGGDCYQVTPPLQWQNGAFWSNTQVDLSVDFDLQFSMYLGVNDSSGADGVVFVLQQLGSSALGVNGGGMGYSSFGTSLGIEFDTYENTEYSDPPYDHIAIEMNGDVLHYGPNNLGWPVQMSSTNANTEDGTSHIVSVQWDAVTHTISVFFDCELRIQSTADIVNTIFGGQSLVFWGFTGATGNLYNQQMICAIPNAMETSALSICPGSSATLNAGESIDGIYSWTPVTWLNDPTISGPVATPDTTITYQVTYTDLCNVTRIKEVKVTVLDNGPPCFALPVTLLSFDATPVGEQVKFHWSVLNEELIEGYAVEVSFDGLHFNALVQTEAKGSGLSITDYELWHQRNSRGSYYRLVHWGVEGSLVISSLIFLSGQDAKNFRLSYDESTETYSLMGHFPEPTVHLDICSLDGKKYNHREIAAQESAIIVECDAQMHVMLLVVRDLKGTVIYSGWLAQH